MEHVGELIRYYRGEAELTQEELARRAGLSTSSVIGIETGETRRPRAVTLTKLARVLRIDPRVLTAGKALAR
jgi:transcriptional regulator with XRE-family HTH domain